jgi:hypothetical protein
MYSISLVWQLTAKTDCNVLLSSQVTCLNQQISKQSLVFADQKNAPSALGETPILLECWVHFDQTLSASPLALPPSMLGQKCAGSAPPSDSLPGSKSRSSKGARPNNPGLQSMGFLPQRPSNPRWPPQQLLGARSGLTLWLKPACRVLTSSWDGAQHFATVDNQQNDEVQQLHFKREEGDRHYLHPSLYAAGFMDKAVRTFLKSMSIMGN